MKLSKCCYVKVIDKINSSICSRCRTVLDKKGIVVIQEDPPPQTRIPAVRYIIHISDKDTGLKEC